ncbi:glycoprotein-N-acetylgalactosamine 3-beta-galactosyltransferase 1-like [Condylostylus longicornis]|uniref:glycoprotein-N-acetylgalactosamine 3-beta-galactosyltransferase 1-like n=1 Tax=Condylostylus longicornis TaxID=2530218 RepID=UPI00244DB350|nr:glycoprotein-N-acetylgalactosamine 3-beta-galactosyltransferase 1-like [Condylostylus longicornis]
MDYLNITEHEHIGENTTLADKLYDEIKVLCWVMTAPDNHKTKAQHVKLTWGKRCNKLLFMSTEYDDELGSIGLNVTEGRDGLWNKTREAFTYIYENHLDEYDWFVKADDDTYFIMENLRFMLSEHRTDTPIYFGSKFQMPSVVYMSGGAGYVLSREAVKRLVEIAFKNSRICRVGASVEDVEIGVCLNAVGVIAGDTRDEEGKSRFHPLSLDNHLEPDIIGHDFWLWDYSYYKFGSGLRYVSDKAVSFHYLTAAEMYICEYLIYHVKPYGIWSLPENLPEKQLTFEEELEYIRNADNDRNLE